MEEARNLQLARENKRKIAANCPLPLESLLIYGGLDLYTTAADFSLIQMGFTNNDRPPLLKSNVADEEESKSQKKKNKKNK